MQKKLGFTLVLIGSIVSCYAQLSWPTITRQTQPWTRWWWEGSAVTAKGLTYNLQQYKKAGLGGVEITPIYGVTGSEKQFVPFLSPQWMKLLDHTLAEGKRLDMGIDLANATGWPFGGPWVGEEDASKTIYYKTYTLLGGDTLQEAISYNQTGMVRTANNKQLTLDEVAQPLSANKDLQSLALDQLVYPGTLPLQLLMAYAEDGAAIDITGKVAVDGKLHWNAPKGKWTLYALFMGLHGKMVERAAPGGEGYAIDHFSAKALDDYLLKFEVAFKGHNVSGIRAFFNDSYEVDDARGQANWTPYFLQEFHQRRGYDLRLHIPALVGEGDTAIAKRVLYDYRATIDELILDHFTKRWAAWGHQHGGLIRNQSHGSPANLLDLYAAVDIPETEGTDLLRFKFATSAANVTGKKLVSSESATWLKEHFLSSWGDVKKALDLYFLGGVNHIFYHGTAYSPPEAPWPGWLFYAAVHFQPTNPQWKHFHTLNEYVARCQSFLQSTQPDNDILLYFPIADRYAAGGKAWLQHFDGMERNFEGTDFSHISEWMLERGYTFDFFSDRQLQQFTTTEKSISTGGHRYQTIILPANTYIPLSSFQKLMELARKGATIICYKKLPADVPGLHKLADRQSTLLALKNQLKWQTNGAVKKAAIGAGAFLWGDDMDAMLAAAAIKKEILPQQGLSFIRKRKGNGYIYFINNRSDGPKEGWFTIRTGARSIALFDPMTGNYGLANWRNGAKGTMEVYLQLQPFESIIVQTFSTKKMGAPYRYIHETGQPQVVAGTWHITFMDGGPQLPSSITTDHLKSWTAYEGEAVKNFSGMAQYTLSFSRPSGKAAAYVLDLGTVHETADVLLNNKRIATLIGPHFKVVIPAAAFKPENTLKVTVANLMANRIAYMDRQQIAWKVFYNTNMPAKLRENSSDGLFSAANWQPLPSGLIGPVTLRPIQYK